MNILDFILRRRPKEGIKMTNTQTLDEQINAIREAQHRRAERQKVISERLQATDLRIGMASGDESAMAEDAALRTELGEIERASTEAARLLTELSRSRTEARDRDRIEAEAARRAQIAPLAQAELKALPKTGQKISDAIQLIEEAVAKLDAAGASPATAHLRGKLAELRASVSASQQDIEAWLNWASDPSAEHNPIDQRQIDDRAAFVRADNERRQREAQHRKAEDARAARAPRQLGPVITHRG